MPSSSSCWQSYKTFYVTQLQPQTLSPTRLQWWSLLSFPSLAQYLLPRVEPTRVHVPPIKRKGHGEVPGSLSQMLNEDEKASSGEERPTLFVVSVSDVERKCFIRLPRGSVQCAWQQESRQWGLFRNYATWKRRRFWRPSRPLALPPSKSHRIHKHWLYAYICALSLSLSPSLSLSLCLSLSLNEKTEGA
jgi:hypothetical protein